MVGKHNTLLWQRKTHGEWQREKMTLLTKKRNHNNNKEVYTAGSKSTGKKVGFASVFADITRRSIHPHSWNNSNERDTKKRGHEMGNRYRLAESNARHREQQRKPSNIKPDKWHTSIAP